MVPFLARKVQAVCCKNTENNSSLESPVILSSNKFFGFLPRSFNNNILLFTSCDTVVPDKILYKFVG